jgi:DNA-binding NarL/FixJ family response regulator
MTTDVLYNVVECAGGAAGVATDPAPSPFDRLTPRELAVAYSLALGRTSREIATSLQISIKTADTHRMHVMKKLETRNAAELVWLALRSGWMAL